jgi:hypothetical protein
MGEEPVASEHADRRERSGLLEEVGGTGNDLDVMLAVQGARRLAVEIEDGVVVAAHDQQRGGPARPRASERPSRAARLERRSR